MTFFRHIEGDDESLWPAFGLGLAVPVGNGLARFSYALLRYSLLRRVSPSRLFVLGLWLTFGAALLLAASLPLLGMRQESLSANHPDPT